jgi:hypothetical protein
MSTYTLNPLPMIEYVEEDIESLVAVKISDTINKRDYEALIPEMEKRIKQCGKINFYMEITDNVNWDVKSFWSDINFNLKHAQDVGKAAFVGDEQFEEKIIELLKPLENAEIRWYNYAEKHKALIDSNVTSCGRKPCFFSPTAFL